MSHREEVKSRIPNLGESAHSQAAFPFLPPAGADERQKVEYTVWPEGDTDPASGIPAYRVRATQPRQVAGRGKDAEELFISGFSTD